MTKRPNQVLVFSPQPNATADEVMEVLKLVMFQSYPAELRTEENLTALYNKLPTNVQRHFQVKDKNDKENV
jgi:hypothetical protein